MTDIRLTTDGDIFSQNTIITGFEEVIQSCIIRMHRHKGEWFLDPSVGVPYIQWFGEKRGVTTDTIEDVIRAELLGVRGVAAVPSVNAEVDVDRVARLTAVVEIFDEDSPDNIVIEISAVSGAARWRVL